MGRRLNTTVQIGAAIYEAGTDESDIDGADLLRSAREALVSLDPGLFPHEDMTADIKGSPGLS